MKLNIFILLLSGVLFASCSDLFDPEPTNIKTKDLMYKEAGFAEGLIAVAYTQIPTNGYSFNDVATDDAVSNDLGNGYLKIATGQWSSSSYLSADRWNACYSAIFYLNTLIEEGDKVNWAASDADSTLFNFRIKGEAYGLRALFMYYLVQSYAGWNNGQLLGIPLITTQQDKNSDFNIPRAGFVESINQIYSDLNEAEKYLPYTYGDLNINSDKVPEQFVSLGIPDSLVSSYNRTMGSKFKGRMDGRITKSIKAQVALLAASKAFLDGADNSWQNAAIYASEVINKNGGVDGLASNGSTWYTNMTEINALSSGTTPPEIIWRTSVAESNSLEASHYPPSLQGSGRCNPTQNLVDAFPMANGYPVNDEVNSGYSATTPYANRDPRLSKYIVYDKSTFGPTASTINIASGTSDDVINMKSGKSTRTGYYMRKLLKETTNLSSSAAKTEKNYFARIRFTELYLIFAEAANEAYGPLGSVPGADYTAYDVIKKIRQRAGITGGDLYLESIKNDKDKMRALIRNERRLELCFEGFRFWDLRRWKEDINASAKGIGISDGAVDLGATGDGYEIEKRDYKSYMYYGPIPLSETLKWNKLSQNEGW